MHAKAAIVLSVAWLALGAGPEFARADGGALRASERRGDRRIAVFTAPTPLRAGPADVSVLVQSADSGTPMTGARVVVSAHPVGRPRAMVRALATTEQATNKLFLAARLELTEPGPWRVEVADDGPGAGPPVGFVVEVDEPTPPWLEMAPWVGWPLAVIGLFLVHEWRGRGRPISPGRSP